MNLNRLNNLLENASNLWQSKNSELRRNIELPACFDHNSDGAKINSSNDADRALEFLNERLMSFRQTSSSSLQTNNSKQSLIIKKFGDDDEYTPKAVIIPLKNGKTNATHEELARRTIQATLEANGIHPSNLELEEMMNLSSYQNLDMCGRYAEDWKEYRNLPGLMPAPGKFKDINGREAFGYKMGLAPQFQADVIRDYQQIKDELAKPENVNRKAVMDLNMTGRLDAMVKIAWEKGYISDEVKKQLGSLTPEELAGAFTLGGVIGIVATTEAGAAALGPVGAGIGLTYTLKQMAEFDHIADGCAKAVNRQQLDQPAKEFGAFLGALSKDGVLALVGMAGGAIAPRTMPRLEEALTTKVGNVKQILKDGIPKLDEPVLASPNGAPLKPTSSKPTSKTALENNEPLEMRRLGKASFKKPVSFPSSKNVKIDMEEIISGHKVGGSRLNTGNKKSLFPEDWSEEKIEAAVREAYKNADTVLKRQVNKQTGEERLELEGSAKGWRIRVWYNKTTQEIETAFPNKADVAPK
jgi:hypothetical protein